MKYFDRLLNIKYINYLVSIGTVSGAYVYGSAKYDEIHKQHHITYKKSPMEDNLDILKQTGKGAIIGGTAALIFPIAIPAYLIYNENNKKK